MTKDGTFDLIFTGIVAHGPPDEKYFKLNDPNDDDIINGEGHVMEMQEYITEMLHYDTGDDELNDELKRGYESEFPSNLIRYDCILMDFSRHPLDWYLFKSGLSSLESTKGFKVFPFHDPNENRDQDPHNFKVPKQVRSLDYIMLVSEKKEAFFATDTSVTSTGIVTAECKSDSVPSLKLKEGDWFAFPITRILKRKKGPYWKTEHSKRFDTKPRRHTSQR